MNAVDMNQYIDRLKLEKELKDFIYKYKDSVYFKYADFVYNISLMLNGSIRGKYNENDFNDLKNYINTHNLENIFMDMIYLIGYVMGINNMFKVRDNNSYIEVVFNAHDKVNDLSVEDFFKLFGLDMEDMFYFDLVDNVLKFVGEVGIYPGKRLG